MPAITAAFRTSLLEDGTVVLHQERCQRLGIIESQPADWAEGLTRQQIVQVGRHGAVCAHCSPLASRSWDWSETLPLRS
jgi:hypothetical protein